MTTPQGTILSRSDRGVVGLLGRFRLRGYLPIVALASALAVGLGVFAPVPRSSAATVVESATAGNFLFEKNDDNTLNITDNARNLTLHLDLDTAPSETTEANFDLLREQLASSVKSMYGWDLNNGAQRIAVRQEISSLSQTLHGIPSDKAGLEENKPLIALREVADGMLGASDCRGRCLQEAMNRVISVMVGATVNRMINEYSSGEAHPLVVLAISVFIGGLAEFTFNVGPAITGIPVETLRKSALLGAVSALILVKSYLDDARRIADGSSTTVREEAKAAAEDVKETAGSSVDTKDYDMVRDEL